jgi:protein tyrosine phosphatase
VNLKMSNGYIILLIYSNVVNKKRFELFHFFLFRPVFCACVVFMFVVRQFQFNAWNDADFVPKSKSMILDLIDLVKDWQNVSSDDECPIIVHCKDGATHSGVFVR